ncbi:unnamed protein product [Orchesella dallaii]|uniref:BRCT domain-containing protein n=1 Tax=Orchesella dallaii TaxID=48710 RepID=A0ABP1RPF3_9HEXA
MVFGTTAVEQEGNNGASTTLKRKRPGPASKTLKRRNTSGGGDGGSEGVSSSSQAQSPSAIPEEGEKCFLCFRDATLCKWDTEEEKRKLMKNLCQAVMPKNDQEEMVGEDEFSCCMECQGLVKRLYRVEDIIQKAELKKASVISLVETAIMEGEGRRLICPSTSSQENAWMKMRRRIVEACRMKQLEDSDMTFHSLSSASLPTEQPMDMEESQENDENAAIAAVDVDEISIRIGNEESGSLNLSREEQKEIEEVVSALVEFVADDAIEDDWKGACLSENEKKATSSSIRISFGSVVANVRHSTMKAEEEAAVEAKKEKKSVKNLTDDDSKSQLIISKVESVNEQVPGPMTEDKPKVEINPSGETVYIARKSTGGGYYKPRIAPSASFLVKSKANGSSSSKLFDSYQNEGDKSFSQASNASFDDDGTNKLFPFVLPENPRFMLSTDKMSPVTRDHATAIIKNLGGLLSTEEEFDPDSVALIAERLTGNEKVVCGIASGTFILKMSYLQASRDARGFLPIKKRHVWRENDAKQGDKNEQKLAKASYSWLLAQRQDGKKGRMFGQKFFLLPTTPLRMGVSARMIKAAGGELVGTKEEATCIIKDGQPPKKNKGIPIKNSSSLYTMIVSDPAK